MSKRYVGLVISLIGFIVAATFGSGEIDDSFEVDNSAGTATNDLAAVSESTKTLDLITAMAKGRKQKRKQRSMAETDRPRGRQHILPPVLDIQQNEENALDDGQSFLEALGLLDSVKRSSTEGPVEVTPSDDSSSFEENNNDNSDAEELRNFIFYDLIDALPRREDDDDSEIYPEDDDAKRVLSETNLTARGNVVVVTSSIVNTTAGTAKNSYGFDIPVENVQKELTVGLTKTGGGINADTIDPQRVGVLDTFGRKFKKDERSDDLRDEVSRTKKVRKSPHAPVPPDMDPNTVFDCRCEYPHELVYNGSNPGRSSKANGSHIPANKSKHGEVWDVDRYSLVNGTYVLPRWHQACSKAVFVCPGYSLRNCRPWKYHCTTDDFPVSTRRSRANDIMKHMNYLRHRKLDFNPDLQVATLKAHGRSLSRVRKRKKSCEVIFLPASHSKCASNSRSGASNMSAISGASGKSAAPGKMANDFQPSPKPLQGRGKTLAGVSDGSTEAPTNGPTQASKPALTKKTKSSCGGYSLTDCLLSGDPVKEQPSPSICEQAVALSGCDDARQNWQASLLTSGFDPFNQETFFVYNVTQPGGGVVDHVTLSWTGDCCVRDASFFGLSLEYGLDEKTCTYGVKYDKEFAQIQSSGFYKLVVAGNVPILGNATTVAIHKREGYCLYKLHGPDCRTCMDISSQGVPSSAAPSGSSTPSANPSRSLGPSTLPSRSPSALRSSVPSRSVSPSANPSETAGPSTQPSRSPSAFRSVVPSGSTSPSANPSESFGPSTKPSRSPSTISSVVPSGSISPSANPSESFGPSKQPTGSPSAIRSGVPSGSTSPSVKPSLSQGPSHAPSSLSKAPSDTPSVQPTGSQVPSRPPSLRPSISIIPSTVPSENPTGSSIPSSIPSTGPSLSLGPSMYELGAISGNVKSDDNNDDLGDTDLSGVIIVVLNENMDIVATTVTDSLGNYLFDDLRPGTYVVTETNPIGFLDVSDVDGGNPNKINVSLATGKNSTGNNFVDEPARRIEGSVLEDVNNDKAGEDPIVNVIVLLFDVNNTLVASTSTDSYGNFEFENLSPGTYIVKEVTPTGLVDVGDSDGGDPNSISVLLNTGNSLGNVFVDERPSSVPSMSKIPSSTPSETPTGSSIPSSIPSTGPSLSLGPSMSELGAISGNVKSDDNNDDLGDTDLSGVIIVVLNENMDIVATTVTDSLGNYLFDDLRPGTYVVTETNPIGFLDVSDVDGGNPNKINVSLAPGKNSTGNNFVDEPARRIEGSVLEDINNDNAGEDPIVNVIVLLFDVNNTLVASTSTDSYGNFEFENLSPGTYIVKEVTPAGLVDVGDSDGGDPNSISVLLNTGDSLGNVFVDERPSSVPSMSKIPSSTPSETPTGSSIPSSIPSTGPSLSLGPSMSELGAISGNVKSDDNNDDLGDTDLSGVIIVLLNENMDIVATTVTDSLGNYLFDDLRPGTYVVTETNPIGFVDVSDVDGGNPNKINVSLAPGKNSTGNNFVDEPARRIEGSVLEDINNDNAGEDPIVNVIVLLFDVNNTLVASTSTDSFGNFEFENLSPGTYIVKEVTPTGLVDVGDSDGGDPNSISVLLNTSDSLGNVFVDERPSSVPSMSKIPSSTPSETPTGSSIPSSIPSTGPSLSLGPSMSELGAISGNVKSDDNNDDLGDTDLSGVIIVLLNENMDIVATTVTDSLGNYLFDDLRPGKYVVTETNPNGFVDVSDVDGGNPNKINVSLAPGKNSTGNNFVDEPARRIEGSVLEDVNNDKAGEDPIVNVIVLLFDVNNTLVASTSTDSFGNFELENLSPGTYIVKEVTPTGLVDVGDSDGGDPNSISVLLNTSDSLGNVFVDERPSSVPSMSKIPSSTPSETPTGSSIPSSIPSTRPSLSLGPSMSELGAITGNVKSDNNNDDLGDTDLSGVIIVVLNENMDIIATTVTDSLGNYLFDDLRPGTYVVTETNPNGFVDVSDVDGGNPNKINVSLAPGKNSTGNNFVDEPARRIEGSVLEDINNDKAGEDPIVNVIVLLFDVNNTLVASTSTDSFGNFEFENLSPGTYIVKEVTPTGLVDVGDRDGGDPNSISVLLNAGDSLGNVFVDERPSNIPSMSKIPSSAPSLNPTRSSLPTFLPNTGPSLSLGPSMSELGAISGNVKSDDNNDDLGDRDLSGVIIVLFNENMDIVATTVTDSLGNYLFDGLRPGTYEVKETNPIGFLDVSDVDGGNPNKINVSLATGKNSTGNNFVDEPARRIDGSVLEDINNDNAGEDPIVNVIVLLFDVNNTLVASTSTDSFGNFEFENLPPGTYNVKEVTPVGLVDVGDSDGGDPNSISVLLNTGDSLGNVFVDERPSSVPVMSKVPSNDPSGSLTRIPAPSTPVPSVSTLPSSAPSGIPTGSSSPSEAPSSVALGIGRSASVFSNSQTCISHKNLAIDDFESPEGWAGWRGSVLSSHAEFSTFLGRFSITTPVSPHKLYSVPNDADRILIELDFYEIDAWKNSSADLRECGVTSDCVFIYISSERIPIGTFGHERDEGTYDGSTNGIDWMVQSITVPADLGYGQQKDQKHRIKITVPKSAGLYDGGILKLELETFLSSNGVASGWDNVVVNAEYDCPDSQKKCPNCILLDFEVAGDGETLSNGDSVRHQWYDNYGIMIDSVIPNRGTEEARIFDTSEPGAMEELGTPNEYCPTQGYGVGAPGALGMPYSNCVARGKVLVIKDLKSIGNGTISLSFARPSKVEHVTLLNIEDEGSVITVTKDDGTITSIPYNALGRNSLQKISIDIYDVILLEINLIRTGALVDVGICFSCSELTGCSPFEKQFDEECTMGQFQDNDFTPVNIIASNRNQVTFRVKHKASLKTLSNIEMWFLNPDQLESKHYCWVFSDVAGQPANSFYEMSTGNDHFIAKCEDGVAKISITAGDGGRAFQRRIDVEEPYCQKNHNPFGDERLQYNGLKRCYWEFTLPCDCISHVDTDEQLR